MTIQINADNNLTIHEGFREKLHATISEELDRFAEHITRVEVHLSDENGQKTGPDDKKCLLEARIKNKQPTVVTAHAANYELAVSNASEKMSKSLNSIFEKMQNH